jgi:hypothetical protein
LRRAKRRATVCVNSLLRRADFLRQKSGAPSVVAWAKKTVEKKTASEEEWKKSSKARSSETRWKLLPQKIDIRVFTRSQHKIFLAFFFSILAQEGNVHKLHYEREENEEGALGTLRLVLLASSLSSRKKVVKDYEQL